MPLPADKTETDRILDTIANGQADAREFLRIMTECVYLADDLVDEDLTQQQKQNYMMRLLHSAFCRLPLNAFFMQYGPAMAPVLMDVVAHWNAADDWRKSGDPKREVFGFVRRENMDSLAVAVAAIVGGIDHARAVTDLLMDTVHNTGETVEDWVREP